MTTYDYTFGQFGSGTVNHPARLRKDILDSTITIALDGIAVSDKCYINFKADLSAGEVTILDGIVANYTDLPITEEPPIQPVKLYDVYNLDPDLARTKVKGVNFDVPATSWGKHAVEFPYEVNMLNGEGYAAFAHLGDICEFSVEPTVVGAVVAPAAQGATTLTVDDGLKNLFVNKDLFPGMWFQYERNPSGAPTGPDSTNPGDDENEVASFDPDTNTITLSSGLQTALSPGDYIYVVVKYGETVELQPDEFVDVGGRAAGAAPVPPNTKFNIWYYNSDSSAVRVRLRLNLKYGPLKES
jgi:hypothetical protein